MKMKWLAYILEEIKSPYFSEWKHENHLVFLNEKKKKRKEGKIKEGRKIGRKKGGRERERKKGKDFEFICKDFRVAWVKKICYFSPTKIKMNKNIPLVTVKLKQ